MHNPINLTEIWRQTEKFQAYPRRDPERDGEMIFLHVKCDERPAHYLSGENWFMSCHSVKDMPGYWEIGVWGVNLNRVEENHAAAARDIMASTAGHMRLLAEKEQEFIKEQEELAREQLRKRPGIPIRMPDFDPSLYWSSPQEHGPAMEGPSP